MTINEYKEIINQTAKYPTQVDNFGLAYCMLGLIGETEELYNEENKDNIIKEAGDCIWYMAGICKNAGLNYDRVFDLNTMIPDDTQTIYAYTEQVKKYYRDGKEINKIEFENVLHMHLVSVLLFTLNISESSNEESSLDTLLSEIMQKNFDKLTKRRELNMISGDGSNREEVVTN
jgi:hypothetical protein